MRHFPELTRTCNWPGGRRTATPRMTCIASPAVSERLRIISSRRTAAHHEVRHATDVQRPDLSVIGRCYGWRHTLRSWAGRRDAPLIGFPHFIRHLQHSGTQRQPANHRSCHPSWVCSTQNPVPECTVSSLDGSAISRVSVWSAGR